MRMTSRPFGVCVLSAALACWPSAAADPPDRAKLRFRHDPSVFALDFSPNGRWLAMAGYDGREWPEDAPADSPPQVRVWDLATGKEAFAFRCHGGRVFSVAFSRDSKTLVS